MSNKTLFMEISIVIVNYNGKSLLKASIGSLNKSAMIENCEIIVVDNNSNDGSVEYLKRTYKQVKIVENKENLGYSGINSALPYCRGRYILFLNNDIHVDKNCIKKLLDAIKNDEKVGMAAPKLINYYNKKMASGGTWLSRSFYNGHFSGNDKMIEVPYLGVGMVRKDLILKLGHIFDPDYFIYGEDVDLGLSLRLMGYKVIFVPEAVIYHMHAMTTRSFEKGRTTFLMERNMLTTFFKTMPLKNIIAFLPYVFFMRLAALFTDIISLRFSNALSRIDAILWIIFNSNVIYEKRKKTQKLKAADDKFLSQIFSEKYLFKKKVIV